MANSRESTESGMEAWDGGVGCKGGMGQNTDFKDLDSQPNEKPLSFEKDYPTK